MEKGIIQQALNIVNSKEFECIYTNLRGATDLEVRSFESYWANSRNSTNVFSS